MLILSHPTGNANVRQAARALNDAGLLAEFWTSICWQQGQALNRLLPNSTVRELNRRSFSDVRPEQIHTAPWREVGRLMSLRLGLSSLSRHETGAFSVDAVYHSLDRKVARRLQRKTNVTAVYAYEDAALATFCAARECGIKTIYELPIGYWRAHRELLEEEAVLEPGWADTLRGKSDSEEKRHRKDEELMFADQIIVPSQFVRRTLLKAGPLKGSIHVIPYGAPPIHTTKDKRPTTASKIKVIFVGMLSQRKGLGYLLRAVEKLGPHVELTMIGKRVGECRALDAALRGHRWIPSLSHDEVLQEIRRHDVMVFPSLFEGFGLVVLEAMSCGVPVIATAQGGAPDFLEDGKDGFLVPIRSHEAIAEKLELLMRHRDRLFAMSQAAIRKAAQHSWESYRQHLIHTVRQALAEDVLTPLSATWSPELQVCNPC
ncbi:MAG TPA: glycosyltransferase family 4 protein [Terriglobales bacterium]|jgi:glycosyltransferase involved in cell wall biosynthesis